MQKTKNIRSATLLVLALAMSCSQPSQSSAPAEVIDLSSTTPILGSLVTGSTSVSVTPAFYWMEVEGATSYDLFLSTESTAGSSPYASDLTASPYTPSVPLPHGTKYHWKIVAKNDGSTSLPSVIRSFTTEKSSGFPAPLYLSPANGSTAYPVGEFSWGAVPGATNNRFMCSTKSDASGPLSWDLGTATSRAVSFFFWPGYTWYWKVVAEDATACSSDTSPVWSFTPATDGIAAPANIAVDSGFTITWDKVDGATKYYVLLNYGGTAFTYNSMAYSSAGTSFSASWLTSGKTIGYTVVALDSTGHTSYAVSIAAARTFSK